jgi:nucleoside-diphosphate-sugar epimerase
MKVVLAGGSGQVGMMLSRAFAAEGHEVVILSRGASGSGVSDGAMGW